MSLQEESSNLSISTFGYHDWMYLGPMTVDDWELWLTLYLTQHGVTDRVHINALLYNHPNYGQFCSCIRRMYSDNVLCTLENEEGIYVGIYLTALPLPATLVRRKEQV